MGWGMGLLRPEHSGNRLSFQKSVTFQQSVRETRTLVWKRGEILEAHFLRTPPWLAARFSAPWAKGEAGQ
jgi:hypothetical protein